MRGSSEPRTAIHAAAGATPSEKPSSRCDQRVKRLVNEYRVTRASATGERYRVRRFNWAAASTKTAQHTTTNSVTNLSERIPAGMARVAVRGLAASICASARRLKAMAADRAVTMQSNIHPSCAAVGIPPAASIAPHKANGSANTECSHLIISNVMPMLRKIRTEYFIAPSALCPKPTLPNQWHKPATLQRGFADALGVLADKFE